MRPNLIVMKVRNQSVQLFLLLIHKKWLVYEAE